MIRPSDAFVLAKTKLKTRKVRTGITVAISGVMFGLLVAAVVVTQGMLSSAERFSTQGLGARYIMSVAQDNSGLQGDLHQRADVIAALEAEHSELVAAKTREAKRLGIDYDPLAEDPSPIIKDSETGEKYVEWYDAIESSDAVSRLLERTEERKAFDIREIAAPYSPIAFPKSSVPLDQGVVYMKDGAEAADTESFNRDFAVPSQEAPYMLAIGDQTINEPFISKPFDASKGEVPVVIPYSHAEKLLDLKPLPNSATAEQRLKRIYEVRDLVDQISVSFCYRSQTSQQLLSEAFSVEEYVQANQSKPDYLPPSLRYKLPAKDSCGAVEILSDTRTDDEKQQAEKRQLFDAKFNDYRPPEQHKVTVRGVGITPDMDSAYNAGSMASLAAGLLSSYTGIYWSIPDGMLAQVDEKHRPDSLFGRSETNTDRGAGWLEGELVEFATFSDAQSFYKKYSCNFGTCGSEGISASPYGSSSLLIAEVKGFFDVAVRYAVLVISVFAVIILAGTIGRTVADGRKESAVFRAIGAKRGDILGIYSVYTLLLALRVVMFALVLGVALAWLLDIWQWQNATVGAQLAFGALDRRVEFHFIDIVTPYIPAIIAIIMAASLLAMTLPVLRAMRRTPIQDMRDDN